MKWHKEVKVNKLQLQLRTQENLRNVLSEKKSRCRRLCAAQRGERVLQAVTGKG